jgi:MoaA/NifB/PqqE/SkfB family radical SAM enzyme
MTASNWQIQSTDGAILAFDRSRGLNVLVRNPLTTIERRQAPRSLQIGLLTPCNLSCEFCYRDTTAPSRLTSEFLCDLLTQAADWGVLEVSFGGGEPMLFKGFIPLLRRLHKETPLGMNFTTNGTLLTREIAEEIGNAAGEIRVSAYLDNDYRGTLQLLKGRRTGLNLLVTPLNIGMIEVIIADALHLGARNVLLLSYKGDDPRLHLSRTDLDRLRCTIERMQHLPLRLDICWYPQLSDLPHLFPRADCGAGDEFLVITPDRAIQPCSFHDQRIPFETFDDLRRIYGELRQQRPPAKVNGCTRQQFVQLELPATASRGTWIWSAFSSNNSGDWTIVGRFKSVELAHQAADALHQLSRAHEAFVSSPEGHAWLKEHDYYGTWPTPPLQQFGVAHGFDWSTNGDGLWWEEEGCGAPVLTAGAVDNSVVVYHPYCMGLPEAPFRKFFAAVGATEFGYWQYDQPNVIAKAHGDQPQAVSVLERYLGLVEAAQYASDVSEPPPWGEFCEDPRVLDDEDNTARLAKGEYGIQAEAGELQLKVAFENTFAGSLALEKWLVSQGYMNVSVQVDFELEPLEPNAAGAILPDVGALPKVKPVRDRFAGMTNKALIDSLFQYHTDAPAALEDAVANIPAEERIQLAHQAWQSRRQRGLEVDWRALLLIKDTGSAAGEWMVELWRTLLRENAESVGFATRVMADVLPANESFQLALEWFKTATDQGQRRERLQHFVAQRNPLTIPLIEDWWKNSDPNTPVTDDWGRLAAASQIDWSTIRRWLDDGRPLSLVALGALDEYVAKGLPESYIKPNRAEFSQVLGAHKARNSSPRAVRSIDRALSAADTLSKT